jgi:hypothetical protein
VKTLTRCLILLFFLIVLLWPRPAAAKVLNCEKFSAGGSYTLQKGVTLDGDLCVLGGFAQVDEGATVDGDVFLVGGTLQMDGTVTASIQAAGGIVTLGEGSTVGGDINLMGGKVVGLDSAEVVGEVNRIGQGVIPLSIQGTTPAPASDKGNPFLKALWLPLRSFLWAALAVLAALFLPRQLGRIGHTASQHFLAAGGIGLTGVLIGVVSVILLALTLICLPFSFLVLLGFLAAWVAGLLAISMEIGDRLAKLIKKTWAPAVSAAIGAILLTLLLNGIALVVPCLGLLPGFLVGCVGIGALLLTRLGTRAYPPQPTVIMPGISEPKPL